MNFVITVGVCTYRRCTQDGLGFTRLRLWSSGESLGTRASVIGAAHVSGAETRKLLITEWRRERRTNVRHWRITTIALHSDRTGTSGTDWMWRRRRTNIGAAAAHTHVNTAARMRSASCSHARESGRRRWWTGVVAEWITQHTHARRPPVCRAPSVRQTWLGGVTGLPRWRELAGVANGAPSKHRMRAVRFYRVRRRRRLTKSNFIFYFSPSRRVLPTVYTYLSPLRPLLTVR